ncbi:MAG: 30S ribosome-binding factor RbfA [Stellaceae bacterium]
MSGSKARRRHASAGGDADRGAGQRQRRVGEQLRHALAQILRDGGCRDPALRQASITVTEVRVSPDLRNATAYVMPLGGANAGDVIAGLRRGAPFLRAQLARDLPLRYMPNLAFALDDTFEQADRISTLLARPEVARDLHPQTAGAENDADAG